MGTVGMIAGGALLGLGAASMGRKQGAQSATDVHSTMAASAPQAPEAPTAVETPQGASTTDNALMEAERQRELQRAALAKQRAREVFTSGLGAAGLAETSRKSLLGG